MKYSISLVLGNKTFTSAGATLLDALLALEVPIKIVGKGFLTVTNGKREKKMMLMPIRCKRLFYPNAKVIMAKQLELLMK